MKKARFSNNINIKNRNATYRFELLDKYITGMVLQGTEIKSIREGKVNLKEGYIYFNGGEAFVKGISIAPFNEGTHYNHEATRERKLLLKKKEIRKIKSQMEEKGLTIVPLRMFINDRGFAKLEIATAKGKKIHDKREAIKERDINRELERIKY